jgi:2-polyprenyl-3-methyl-5-hydroxy-6-metoxy-1,4-benzoquinol methylase
VWLSDPPAPEEMGLHYSEEYHRAIAKAGETGAQDRWRRHRDLISRYKQGGAILDIGCSSGAFLGTMKGDGWKLYGIEREQTTAEKAQLATGAEVFAGDAMDAPFAGDGFDAVTCFDLLEHVYDPRAFLSRVLEWLKPGGMFFMMLPNIGSWEARAFGSYWYGLELPRHLSHFSPRSLRKLMTSLGFREVHLGTPRTSYVERSVAYLWSAGLEMLGREARPQSRPKRAGIPKRAVRKVLRVTLLEPFAAAASLAGAGGSIEGVFGKFPAGS